MSEIKESWRKLFNIGGSKGITLPREWVKFVEWVRRQKMAEVYCARNHIIIIAPPDEQERARRFLEKYEEETTDLQDREPQPGTATGGASVGRRKAFL